MISEMVLRQAQLSDIDALIELRKILIEQGEGYYTVQSGSSQLRWQQAYRQWLATHISGHTEVCILVADNDVGDTKIAGCAIGIIDKRVPYPACLNGKVGWIQTVVVAPNYRQQGLAKKLMEQLSAWFKRQDVGVLTLQTTPIAAALYKSLGFIDSGEPFLLKYI